jgi:hypothetical protein
MGEYHLDCRHCTPPAFTRFEQLGQHSTYIDGESKSYAVAKCTKCREIVFLTLGYGNYEHHVVGIYPHPKSTPESFPHSVPAAIRRDFAEAMTCFHARAFKASVVMCRRVIFTIAKEHKIEGDTTREQIKALSDAGLITKALFDAAHESGILVDMQRILKTTAWVILRQN